MACCTRGDSLLRGFEYARKREAYAYANLIAHQESHQADRETSLRHMRLVDEIAHGYTEGVIDPHREVPSGDGLVELTDRTD